MGPIKVEVKGGALVYDGSRNAWTAEGDVAPGVLEEADWVTRTYSYSAGHGYPGFLLAEKVAFAVGGKAVLPKDAPFRDDVTY